MGAGGPPPPPMAGPMPGAASPMGGMPPPRPPMPMPAPPMGGAPGMGGDSKASRLKLDDKLDRSMGVKEDSATDKKMDRALGITEKDEKKVGQGGDSCSICGGNHPGKGCSMGKGGSSKAKSRANDHDEDDLGRGGDGKNWIAGATKNKGALHRKLGVPEGTKIPASKMAQAAKSSDPTERKEASLAKTLSGFGKGGAVGRGGDGPVTRLGNPASGRKPNQH
jgi:hypothetical protein